jgi:hypothetical protein
MASPEAFSIACIQLFSRLWTELERPLAADDGSLAASCARRDETYVEALRLELILLLDACRSARWRMQLTYSQRHVIRSLTDDVLGALNASSDGIPSRTSIEGAQNRLFDAVLSCVETLSPSNLTEHCVKRWRLFIPCQTAFCMLLGCPASAVPPCERGPHHGRSNLSIGT